MGWIQIEGMEFFAYHGCFAEERIIGTKFRVDISLKTDTSAAESTDDISKTVNYQSVYLLIKTEMEQKSHLLEHVARRILTKVRQTYPEITDCKVKISKLNPPLGGKIGSVSVTLSSNN